jgi:hypothetical protein
MIKKLLIVCVYALTVSARNFGSDPKTWSPVVSCDKIVLELEEAHRHIKALEDILLDPDNACERIQRIQVFL